LNPTCRISTWAKFFGKTVPSGPAWAIVPDPGGEKSSIRLGSSVEKFSVGNAHILKICLQKMPN
jgi:hypothetical protein